MIRMPLEVRVKQPDERVILTFDFIDVMDVSDTITSLAETISKSLVYGSGDISLSGSVVVAPTQVKVLVDGGTADSDYKVTVRVSTQSGQVLEADVIIEVRDL